LNELLQNNFKNPRIIFLIHPYKQKKDYFYEATILKTKKVNIYGLDVEHFMKDLIFTRNLTITITFTDIRNENSVKAIWKHNFKTYPFWIYQGH